MTLSPEIRPGLTGVASRVVTDADTAARLGSGTLDVLATPMLVALLEAAAVACVEHLLPAGHTSLGTEISVTHTAPSPIGAEVTATARLTRVDGRTLQFALEARDGHGPIGAGRHTRVVVESTRFLAKLKQKNAAQG